MIFWSNWPGPFEISDGDLAVGALAQRLQEFLRGQRQHIALALQRLLVRVHRIGHVDRDHQFDVDRNGVRTACRRKARNARQPADPPPQHPTPARTAIARRRRDIRIPFAHAMLPQPLTAGKWQGRPGTLRPALHYCERVAFSSALICLARIARSTVIASSAVMMSSAATMMNTAVQLPVICLM